MSGRHGVTDDRAEALRVVVVGDVFLDVDLEGAVTRLCPDAPAPVVDGARESVRPGGAGLAALMLALDGHAVTLVTALGRDAAGTRARGLLEERGVAVRDLGAGGTTMEKTRVLAEGRVLARVDRGGPPRVGDGDGGLGPLAAGADAVLVDDYGYGVAAHPGVRAAIAGLDVPVVWDPHPRGPRPVPGVRLVTPNLGEARGMAGGDPDADMLRRELGAEAVAITMGARGAELSDGLGPSLRIPAPRIADPGADCLGAGDRFAGAAAVALGRGASAAAAVEEALRTASGFVSDGGVEALGRAPEDEALAVAERVRRAGGTVVATGGCFDLVHAGHVASLSAARSLGDCLVVLLNSDASVRRLKGPTRPVVGEGDRAALLRALRPVDAVLVFDEDTPVEALRRLRPDVFAKGADYDPATLPEAEVMRALGGRVEALPFIPGRSTTRLIQEVVAHGR